MDFAATEDVESIRVEAERLAAGVDDDYWRAKDSAKGVPWGFYPVLAAGTLLHAVAASGGAMNAASTLHLSIFGMGPVIHHGSEALKRRVLPRTASSDLHVSFGV